MTEESRIPPFRSIEEEAEFWDTHSPVDYLDELEPVEVKFAPDAFRRGREPTRGLTVKLPESTIHTLRELARSQGIGPTTLVRMWIFDRLREMNRLPPSDTSR
jgi:hypothetical protein